MFTIISVAIKPKGITMNEALKRVLETVGSQKRLGELVGYSQASVYKWLYHIQKIPPEIVPSLVSLSDGEVKAHELRPDLPQLFPPPEQ